MLPFDKPFLQLRPAASGLLATDGDDSAFFCPISTTSRLPRVTAV